MEAMERFLSDRRAMLQHAQTTPRTRVFLWMALDPAQDEFQVWELGETVPPSTAEEELRDSSRSGPDSSRRRGRDPELISAESAEEVSDNGPLEAQELEGV